VIVAALLGAGCGGPRPDSLTSDQPKYGRVPDSFGNFCVSNWDSNSILLVCADPRLEGVKLTHFERGGMELIIGLAGARETPPDDADATAPLTETDPAKSFRIAMPRNTLTVVKHDGSTERFGLRATIPEHATHPLIAARHDVEGRNLIDDAVAYFRMAGDPDDLARFKACCDRERDRATRQKETPSAGASAPSGPGVNA
jgi:hypothetical protein